MAARLNDRGSEHAQQLIAEEDIRVAVAHLHGMLETLRTGARSS